MTYGNNMYHRVDMNNRLQPCRIRTRTSTMSAVDCATADPTGDFLHLKYGYNHGVSNNGSVMTANASGQQSFSRTFTYDELNRLKTMSWSVCNYTWSYDIWGNRVSQDATGGTGPCGEHFPAFNTKNQIADSGYTYDAAGNLIAEPGRTYQYDAENRLITVNSGTVATYTYDALGRRTAKTVPGSPRVRYIYNLYGNVVAEFEGTSWMRGYAHAGGELIGQYKSSQLFYSHKDLLGSTRIMSKVNLTVQECDDYLPYGELDVRACMQPPPPTTTIARKFTGHYRDTESGLDHTLFRKYSFTTGRWLSADPLGGAIGDPQSLNRFAYVRNMPTFRFDPRGLCDEWITVVTPDGSVAYVCHGFTNDESGGQGGGTSTSGPSFVNNRIAMWNAIYAQLREREAQRRQSAKQPSNPVADAFRCAAANASSFQELTGAEGRAADIFLGNDASDLASLILGPNHQETSYNMMVDNPTPVNVIDAVAGVVGQVPISQYQTVTQTFPGGVLHTRTVQNTLADAVLGRTLAKANVWWTGAKALHDVPAFAGALIGCSID